MLFYADQTHSLDLKDARLRVVGTLTHAAERWDCSTNRARAIAIEQHPPIVGAAIALGEIHQAVADLLNADRDGIHPETDALLAAGLSVGRCVAMSAGLWRGSARDGDAASMQGMLREAASAVAGLPLKGLPQSLEARVPEGYAFYSLYPEMYLDSLARLLASEPSCPGYAVIGIRSIGTSLAAIVAGSLSLMGYPVFTETLRPRGHPFDRYVEMSDSLRTRIGGAVSGGHRFLIVDEGPGLTCSSFLSVRSALASLGVEDERIAFLSAWRGAPSIYASDENRSLWRSQSVFYTDASDAFQGWRALIPFVDLAETDGRGNGKPMASGEPSPIEDLSYGWWRKLLYLSEKEWPAIHRPTERTKLLIRRERPLLAKFAGLGEYGFERLERARLLAGAGLSPDVVGLAYGFLLYRFVEDAVPMSPSDLDESVLARLVEYYAFVSERFSAPPAPRFDSLVQMASYNVSQSVGIDLGAFVVGWRERRDRIDGRPLVRLDGHPEPHEWLRTNGSTGSLLLKSDSADHFSDHTLTGQQSILWDLAGACEEWEMNPDATARFLDMWGERFGDLDAAEELPFYRVAYLAFRIAAMHYAIHSTDEDDIRTSLQHRQWGYKERLKAALILHPIHV